MKTAARPVTTWMARRGRVKLAAADEVESIVADRGPYCSRVHFALRQVAVGWMICHQGKRADSGRGEV